MISSSRTGWLMRPKSNDQRGGGVPYPVPVMSTEGILILAEAHTQELARGPEIYKDAMSYEQTAEKFPEENNQYVFAFLLDEHENGEVLNQEI
jgi:hypothetical protein